MSDLSNLLGDLYGDQGNPDAPPVRHELAADDRAPEWASQNRLDKAFENWTPEAHVAPRASDEDLTAALSAALSVPPAPAPAPAPAPVPAPAPAPAPSLPSVMADMPQVPHAGWTSASAPAPAPAPTSVPMSHGGPTFWVRGDDDIFSTGGAARKKGKKK